MSFSIAQSIRAQPVPCKKKEKYWSIPQQAHFHWQQLDTFVCFLEKNENKINICASLSRHHVPK
jgi:hypothetical protein